MPTREECEYDPSMEWVDSYYKSDGTYVHGFCRKVKAVHLQGLGDFRGMEVERLQRGDVLNWNYGERSKVKELIPNKSKKTFVVVEEYPDGKIYRRRMNANKFVVVNRRK